MAEEKFEEDKFMKNLVNLKDTQESIQGFSGWCIRNRKAAYKMARCWIKVIKKVCFMRKQHIYSQILLMQFGIFVKFTQVLQHRDAMNGKSDVRKQS